MRPVPYIRFIMSINEFTSTPRKAAAVGFLQMVVAGKIREAYDKYISPDFIHHNPYFKGDRQSLMSAMQENENVNPGKTLEVQHVVEEGDIVMVHSRLRFQQPQAPEMTVVHIFRFASNLAVEAWDIGMAAPASSPNENGMF